jgi:hypothetical protein
VGSLGLCGALSGAAPIHAQATDPAARINAFYAALLAAMKQAGQLGPKGRYDKLAPVVGQTFDVAGMMRIAGSTASRGRISKSLPLWISHPQTSLSGRGWCKATARSSTSTT